MLDVEWVQKLVQELVLVRDEYLVWALAEELVVE
jgi:hydroxypyruvate isomerase